MTKEELRAVTEFDRARSLSVFIILKDGDICGRLTARHIKRTATSHIAFMIYGFVNNDNPIAGYERVTGVGFNREDFGIDVIRLYDGVRYSDKSRDGFIDTFQLVFSSLRKNAENFR